MRARWSSSSYPGCMCALSAETTPMPPEVPDLLTIDIAPGAEILLTSDLHLHDTPTEASRWAEEKVSTALEELTGPALLVLAGDVIELWAGEKPDAAGALAAHPRFAEAVRSFAGGENRRVVCLPGNHDGRLGWDPVAADAVKAGLGAELAFAVDLALTTADGRRVVHVEHGHRWDPANRFEDPRQPLDTPLGQHVVQEVLPEMATTADSSLLHGLEGLSDPRTFPSFVSSRVFYRRVVKDLRWLLIPIVIAIGTHYGIFLLDEPRRLRLRARDFVIFDLAVVLAVAITAALILVAGRRTWSAANAGMTRKRGKSQNDNARVAAQEMVAGGYAGMVSGHTHHPELTSFGSAFYANTGSGTKVVDRFDARYHFPNVFIPRLQLSWVLLEAGEQGWTARLFTGHLPCDGSTALERFMARRKRRAEEVPTEVAAHPQ